VAADYTAVSKEKWIMEVEWFLRHRTDFLRYYYDSAAAPFLRTQQQIEKSEPPYDGQSGDPDEPPYLEEWSDSHDGLALLGRSCLSMLSATMKLYFAQWEKELGITLDAADKKIFKDDGLVGGYRAVFEAILKSSWKDSGADFAILEQIVLARNNDQHPEDIATLGAQHKERDWKKYPDLFFLSETDQKELAQDADSTVFFMLRRQVDVSRDKLFTAIGEVEKLAEWLEPQLMTLRYGSATGFPTREDDAISER
jgi:hypothetical protein